MYLIYVCIIDFTGILFEKFAPLVLCQTAQHSILLATAGRQNLLGKNGSG